MESRPLHPSLVRRHSTNRSLPKGEVPNRSKTNSSIKPSKFHSTYVSFDGRKTREERKMWLKVRLYGFPEVLVSRSAPTAVTQRSSKYLASFSTLIGPFKPSHALTKRGSYCHALTLNKQLNNLVSDIKRYIPLDVPKFDMVLLHSNWTSFERER